MKSEVDILMEDARSHISRLLGHAEELQTAAKFEQRLLEALCSTKEQLDAYKRKYEARTLNLCTYIDVEKVQEAGIWQPEQIEEKLREACERDSKTLATFLKDFEKKGYFNFHGDPKTKILKTLRAHFPSMRQYEYNTFATYF